MHNGSKIFTVIIGAFIVLMGLSIIFGLVIPIFKILLGIFFIYLGFMILTRRRHWRHWHHHHHHWKERNSTIFDEESINITNDKIDKEYSIVFGKANYDLSEITLKDSNIVVRVSVVFGSAVIKINKNTPVKAICSAAFGSARTPDTTIISFGKHDFTTANFDEKKPYLYIEADVAFGNLEII
jgi:hypothetical protein